MVLRINISPVQLVGPDFVASVARVLAQFGLPGEAICLEITEHVAVRDLERTQTTLQGLKAIGVAVAIDDFGTGYSSLSHLKSLSVDVVKIDRSFVRRLGQDDDDLAIVKSIVGLARSFDLSMVAEGVETPEAARTLLNLGCYRAQGFLLAKPMAADAVAALLEAGAIDIEAVLG